VNTSEAIRMISDHAVQVLGTSAVTACVSNNAEGGVDIVTAGADNDQTILVPHETTNACLLHPDTMTWGSDRGTEFEVLFKTPSSIATILIMAGLKADDSPVDLAITDADLAVLQFNTDDTDTNWGSVSDTTAGSDIDKDTGHVVAASTIYKFGWKFDHKGVCHVFINDEEVDAIDFSNDAVDFIPMIAVQSLDGDTSATPALTVYGWRLSRRFGASD